MRRLGVLCVITTVLALGACSSNDDGADADSAAPSSSTSTTAAGDGDEVDLGGAIDGSFCDAARELEQRLSAAMEGIANGAEAGPVFSAAVGPLEEVADLAPDEIAADVDTIVSGYTDLIEALEAVDYDFLALTPEQQAVLTTPEMQAASERVEEYGFEVCGFPRPQS